MLSNFNLFLTFFVFQNIPKTKGDFSRFEDGTEKTYKECMLDHDIWGSRLVLMHFLEKLEKRNGKLTRDQENLFRELIKME